MKKRKEKERRMIEALDKHDMEELDTADWKCRRWCKKIAGETERQSS